MISKSPMKVKGCNTKYFRDTEERIIRTLSKHPEYSAHIRQISQSSNVSEPAVRRILNNLYSRLSLGHTIQINYSRLGLRLIGVFISLNHSESTLIDDLLDHPTLLQRFCLEGGLQRTYLALYAMPAYLIAQLRATLYRLSCRGKILDYRIVFTTNVEQTMNMDSLDSQTGIWNLNIKEWTKTVQKELGLPTPVIDYSSANMIPGSLDYSGETVGVDHRDLELLSMLFTDRSRTLSDIALELESDVSFIASRLTRLNHLGLYTSTVNIDLSKIGLTETYAILLETNPAWTQTVLVSMLQRLPFCNLFRLDFDLKHPGSKPGILAFLSLPSNQGGNILGGLLDSLYSIQGAPSIVGLYRVPNLTYSRIFDRCIPEMDYYNSRGLRKTGSWYFSPNDFIDISSKSVPISNR